MLSLGVTALVRMFRFHTGVPGFDLQLWFLTRISVNAEPGKQPVMVQVIGFLTPTQEAAIELLAPCLLLLLSLLLKSSVE